MRLLRDHPGAFAEDVQLQTKAGGLLIDVDSVSGFSEAAFNAMMIQILYFPGDSGGQKVVMPKMPLRDALNIDQFGEGFFQWGKNKITGNIVLSNKGAVSMDKGGYFSINYDGFPADAKTNIYADDSALKTEAIRVLEEILVSGTTRDIDVTGIDGIYLPITDANGNGVSELQLTYGSTTVMFLERQLQGMQYRINDIACVIDQQLDDSDGPDRLVKFGYDRLLYVNTERCSTVKITPKTKAGFSIYTEQHLSFNK